MKKTQAGSGKGSRYSGLAAQNLLDAVRKDVVRVYESLDEYQRRASASTELDQEESDPWVLLTFRGTF